MDRFSESESARRGALRSYPETRVHVLSEQVFCPRAAILALESGDDCGEEDRPLGPRLDGFEDYDEHRFAEELHNRWRQLCLWLTLLAPAILLVLAVWWLTSLIWGALVSLPLFVFLAKIWDSLTAIVALVREQALFRAASPAEIDLTSNQVREVNWWALRKAGFDCYKPPESHHDLSERLVGRPWRVLTKGTTLRIPVIRKHRGDRVWHTQHLVRVAAYCKLIEACELADAPFGVLMFAGSKECLILPNSNVAKMHFEKAMEDTRELMEFWAGGKYAPQEPTDARCRGCHWGRPCEYVAGLTDTILNGNPQPPLQTRAKNDKYYHCPCGDKFGGVPPHDDAIALGMTKPRI